ncbi:MAG: hypothetical protein OXK77_18160 [Gemmatimonadota bacterium]|nr:hypothetical protein [Gemmatimonadota bacterium]MDE2863483.1 hypothetical protein [Gemmatimonadota bacterium]MYB04792.1 hypothetical protein [Gemmatimonadota bacterium]MYG23672.1 hypothetical protein [Gemmatimonadota bacterium]MYJ39489.1 hypothetical protein [Gemmatimonadota bacterium]
MLRRVLMSTALTASLMACGDAYRADSLQDADRFIALALDTVYEIGLDEDVHYFGRVSSIGFDGSGRLHVLDTEAHEVTSWAGDGRMIRRFGSSGDGPGEFRTPRGAYVFRDGTVAVHDIGHRALVTFDSAGRNVENIRLAGGPVPGSSAVVLTGVRLVGPDDPWITSGNARDNTRPVYRFSLDGDSMASELLFVAWRSTESGMSFVPSLRHAALPDGRIVAADSAVGYRIDIISTEGAIDGTLERPIDPWPVTEEVMAAERERLIASLPGERGLARARDDLQAVMGIRLRNEIDLSQVLDDSRALIEDRRFATHVPVIDRLRADWDGRIWVVRSDSLGGGDGPIDLITVDGGYLGSWHPGDLGLPAAFGPDGLMAYRRSDEFGTQYILVVRLARRPDRAPTPA